MRSKKSKTMESPYILFIMIMGAEGCGSLSAFIILFLTLVLSGGTSQGLKGALAPPKFLKKINEYIYFLNYPK